MGLFGSIKSAMTSASGEDISGTITGIRVWEQSDEDSTTTYHEFRIELPDRTVLGIRQEAPIAAPPRFAGAAQAERQERASSTGTAARAIGRWSSCPQSASTTIGTG